MAVEAAPVEPPPKPQRTPLSHPLHLVQSNTGTRAQAGTRPRGGRTEAPPTGPTTLPGTGHITIRLIPTARVYVDGEFIRTTPYSGSRWTRGHARLSFGRRMEDHHFPLGVRDGADLNRVWSFEESRFVGD